MTEDTAAQVHVVEREARTWSNQLPLIVLTTLVAAVFSLAGAFGSRLVGTTDTALILAGKVDTIIEQNKAQDAKLTQSDASSREILMKIGTLITREEFARYNEAAERRFQRQDQQINDLARRVDTFEMTMRALQQAFIDRTNKR